MISISIILIEQYRIITIYKIQKLLPMNNKIMGTKSDSFMYNRPSMYILIFENVLHINSIKNHDLGTHLQNVMDHRKQNIFCQLQDHQWLIQKLQLQ